MFFNEQGMLNLDEAVMNQPTFKKIMEDGIVTEQEVKEQSEKNYFYIEVYGKELYGRTTALRN